MKRFCLLICFFCTVELSAQTFVGGLLPEISVSHRWAAEKWRITGQLESMQQALTNAPGDGLIADYRYIRTDLTFVLSYRLNANWTLAGGNLVRFTNDQMVYRALQQLSYTRRGQSIRFAHRVRTDQTFVPDQATAHRLRYRFTVEVPLAGRRLDKREWYLLTSAEELLRYQSQNWTFEQRVGLSLGHYFSSRSKLELGLDYRLNNFLGASSTHRLWNTLTYFHNF